MKTGLYLHIPFCKQKCNYCDFASFAGREFLIDAYVDALLTEAARAPRTPCQTMYIGGGTPSLLPLAAWEKLVAGVEKFFGPVANFAESTVEANPESLTKEKINFLRGAGFNRLSIGLQSFHDAELKTLGRVHTQADFLRAYENARAAGFNNINVDLIAGLPGQTLESFLQSLQAVVALEPEHLSVYGLEIEEGTPFFERGVICDQVLMRQMLEQTHAQLSAAGFEHYEISNYARPGFASQHNRNYWQYGEYIGLGSAAASFMGGVRRQNTPDPTQYIEKINGGQSAVCFEETLDGPAREGEKLLLALRQLGGTEPTEKQAGYFAHEIEKHVQNGLLERDGKKVKLTQEGIFLANEVFRSFVEPFEDICK